MTRFPRRGEIWLAQLPADQKVRPILIVSPDGRNRSANSVLAVPITTNLRPLPTHVALAAGSGSLTHDSMARCENVSYALNAWLVGGPLGGVVSPGIMREVDRALVLALGLAE